MLWPSMDKSRDWGIKDRHTKRVCHTACGAYCVMITGNEIGKTRTLEPVGVLCMNFKRTSSTISLLLFLSRFLTVTLRTCVWDFSLQWYIPRMLTASTIQRVQRACCAYCAYCAYCVQVECRAGRQGGACRGCQGRGSNKGGQPAPAQLFNPTFAPIFFSKCFNISFL